MEEPVICEHLKGTEWNRVWLTAKLLSICETNDIIFKMHVKFEVQNLGWNFLLHKRSDLLCFFPLRRLYAWLWLVWTFAPNAVNRIAPAHTRAHWSSIRVRITLAVSDRHSPGNVWWSLSADEGELDEAAVKWVSKICLWWTSPTWVGHCANDSDTKATCASTPTVLAPCSACPFPHAILLDGLEISEWHLQQSWESLQCAWASWREALPALNRIQLTPGYVSKSVALAQGNASQEKGYNWRRDCVRVSEVDLEPNPYQ